MVGKKVDPTGINEVQDFYIHSREGILQHDDFFIMGNIHLFKNSEMPSKIVGTKDTVAEEKPEQEFWL